MKPKPFKAKYYRPNWAPEGSPEEEDWADNPMSNSMAWWSTKLFPRWCKEEGHWSGRLTNYLWTLCPCCLLMRGAALGFISGAVSTGAVALIVMLIRS